MGHTIFNAIVQKFRALLSVLVFLLIGLNGRSQTVLHTEDFESGSPDILLNTLDLSGTLTGDNPWTINNIYLGGVDVILCVPPIPLIVPPTPLQPAGITNFPNSTYLHVTPQAALNIGGLLPAAGYVVSDGLCLLGGASTFSGMSTDVSTIGQDSVTFDMWWMCGGSDLYYGEVYYSIDGGSAWLPVINPLNGTTKWKDQLTWTNTEVTDPNWDGQATLRFGYRFITGSTITGSETYPGFSIDDMSIIGHDVCHSTSSFLTVESCDEYISPSGNTWTTTDIYTDTIPNVEGCDSIITIDLTVNLIDTTVTQDGVTLTAAEDGADYQWLDCGNGHIAITVATNQTFAGIANGSFAVEISLGNCKDTSKCYVIEGVGLEEYNPGAIVLQPNPSHDQVTLLTEFNSGIIIISDMSGRVLMHQLINQEKTEISLDAIREPGVYLVTVTGEDGNMVSVVKMVVE